MKLCGIPYLAKNERDMGHPRSVVRTELGPASSHTPSLAPEVRRFLSFQWGLEKSVPQGLKAI